MQLSTTLEKIFYHYARQNQELFNLVTPDFFQNKDIQNCFRFDKRFFEKYAQLPTKQQVVQMISTQKENGGADAEEIQQEVDKVQSIFKTKIDEYSAEWLKENAEAWIEWKTLDTSFIDAINLMKSTKVDVNNIKEIVQKVKTLILEKNNLSFQFSQGLDFFNPEDHFKESAEAYPTGYEYFDACLAGGYRPGTLYCVIAESGKGKSIVLGNLTIAVVKQGYNAAFITLEMGDTDVLARIGSNLLDVPIDEYKEFARDPAKVKKKISKFRKGSGTTLQTPGQLFIKEYPTSAAGVPEFEAYLKKVEELQGIKFSLIAIDYINICMNWKNPNSENTYMKIKQLAEDLRAMGMRNKWTILTASQVNRSGVGNSDLTTQSLSESMGLLHTVDGMFALMQDEEQRANGIFIMKAIKLRNSGEINSKKRFIVDYSHMRITEDTEHPMYNMDDIFKDEE